MSDTKNQKKTQRQILNKNIIESLSDIGSGTVDIIKNETKTVGQEFLNQFLPRTKTVRQSGEIAAGQTLEMDSILSGETEKQRILSEQLFFERRLLNEEQRETNKKLGNLRLRLRAMQTEALRLMNSTKNLSEEVKTAVLTGSTSNNEYNINFFESIIQMIVSFRKKIDNALTWFIGTNKRAEKKNYWARYKKGRGSFLLSPDHYLQRSAG